jgi:hypothetical protein
MFSGKDADPLKKISELLFFKNNHQNTNNKFKTGIKWYNRKFFYYSNSELAVLIPTRYQFYHFISRTYKMILIVGLPAALLRQAGRH